MPTLSGDAVVQPSSVDDGGSQARFRCPGTMPSACTEVVETVNASMRLAPRMLRRGKRSRIILLPQSRYYAAGGTEIFTEGRSSIFWWNASSFG